MNVGLTPLEIFRAKGIPHRKMEDWKYTDLRTVLDIDTIQHTGGAGAVFTTPANVEQVAAWELGSPKWVESLLESRPEHSVLDEAARAGAGCFVFRVPADAQIADPLRMDFFGNGYVHIAVLVERGGSLVLRETHVDGWGFSDISIFVRLAEGARLTHFKQSPLAIEQVAVETVSVLQDRNSRYRAHFLQGGAKLSRTELNIVLNGEGAEADLSGVTVLGGNSHADITTRIDHVVGHTTSRQLFKLVAGGHSRAIYQGKIVVHEGANGSDSRQTAKALLLGARAEADLKPELEILADDVKCAHGAAAGDLDADSLFYLRARGIPEHEAREMLIEAFLQEVVDGIEDEGAGASAAKFIENGLTRAMVEAP